MNDCEKVAVLLSARRDGELKPEEIPLLEKHLRACRLCREQDARFEAVDDLASHFIGSGYEARSDTRMKRLLSLGAAALVVAALSLVVLGLSDNAGAGDAVAHIAAIEEMNDERLHDQDAVLETFAWDLNAMKMTVRCTGMDEENRRALLAKIDDLLATVEKTRRDDGNNKDNRKGE